MGIVIEFQKKKNLAQLRERVLHSIVPLHGITVREVLAQYIWLLEQPIRSVKEQQSMYALTRGLNQIGLYMAFSEESQGLDTPAYLELRDVDDFIRHYPMFLPMKEQLTGLSMG